MVNPIISTYSQLADEYDDDSNIHSCWGQITRKALASVTLNLKPGYKRVVDVGCGTGRELFHLASRSATDVQFIGIEPAENMREKAARRMKAYPNVQVLDGSFESMPIEARSVDYLYSILAFHWVSDLDRAVDEVARALKPTGEMDLVFIGRYNGQEFIKVTSPIFMKYMGLASLVESAKMRKQLRKDEAIQLFGKRFQAPELLVEESYETYYDTREGHWSWWVRIEGHFVNVPADKKKRCDQEVKQAISTLVTDKGIPYTVHLLHVSLRRD